jgi:uncharacterized protein (UPF0333 family)
MDTMLKYLFYLALIFIVYLIIAGFYEGKISKNSTIGEVAGEVSDNAKRIISETYDKAEGEVNTETERKTEQKSQNGQK